VRIVPLFAGDLIRLQKLYRKKSYIAFFLFQDLISFELLA